MAESAEVTAAKAALEAAQKAAASRAGKTTEERLAEMKTARAESAAAQAAARTSAKATASSTTSAAELAKGKAFAEQQIAESMRGAVNGRPLAGVVGSSIAQWIYDPKTGKKRTPQEIVAAVTEAVLADKSGNYGITLDPLTGVARPATGVEKVRVAMTQLVANAQFEGTRLGEAKEVADFLRGSARGATRGALVNQPELWTLGKETVGTIIDRKIFDEDVSTKRFVLDPTKNQLTPEQLKQFREIGSSGAVIMAIDPITGFQVSIDSNGGYTLGEEPSGDVTGLDYRTYQGGYTSPNYNPLYLGGQPDSLGTDGSNGSIDSQVKNADGSTTVTYSNGTKQTFALGSNIPGTTGNNISGTTGGPTTNIAVLKAALKGMGFSSTIVESSTSFLNGLIRDGLDYDNATEIFLNNKEYTLKNGSKITSPFYTEYGYLNEGLTVPKTANELFNTVEGFKGVADKYKLSPKYLTQDALKSYVKNDVTVKDLAERAGTAQLRAVESDPFQVDALIKQGFIASAADLADFYLDPKIGKEQLELNRQTGVFTAEALRRTKSGISTSAAQLSGFKQLTATLSSKGYSEAQIAQLAGTGFENIAQTLQPTTQLAQFYEKAGGTVASNAALTEDIQKSLLQEEFMGTASERRKRLSEQNVRSFQGQAGTTSGSLRTSSVAGLI